MQGYSYSTFSLAAIVIHLIINYDLLRGKGVDSARGKRYRMFLWGLLSYYIADGAWGIFAGLGWNRCLYIDTIFFFLTFATFVVMWSHFVINYLDLGKWTTRILSWFGYGILAFNLAAVAANPFTHCFFHIDDAGIYQTGFLRNPAIWLLVVFNGLMAVSGLLKFFESRDSVRRRSMMVFLCSSTLAEVIALQIIWPLTAFTSLGCLISNCFLHVFVIQDEQTARHMAELEEALERARAAEKARSMFFSIVSHDIRTPLNAILGYSELLQNSLPNQSDRDEALKAIRASGTTLLQLVNDVLDLAKMDSGKMLLHPEPVDLTVLTDEVFSSFQLAASEKGIVLIDQTAGIPTVQLDEHRFRQILFNLIGNAVKFTEHGSVSVDASYAETNLVVSVSDTGSGIPRDMLEHIMDPFVQVQDPSHTADRVGGTGLGLSICRSLTEVMGGEIEVESELGKGSTFRIRIPGVIPSGKRTEPAAEPKSAAERELPHHVLVVDDSPVNRAVLTAFLKKAGIDLIDQAGDGGEALSKVYSEVRTDHPYDFILSDLWMPNMNGIEFIEKLRVDARFRRLPVFAVTADTEFQRDDRTRLFTGILLKPLAYEKLIEIFPEKKSV